MMRSCCLHLPERARLLGCCSLTLAQADNRFMVSGGYDPEGVPSCKVEAYNPKTFEWDILADLPQAARDHKMCAVPGASLKSNRTASPSCLLC
jgi:hypothetical protein